MLNFKKLIDRMTLEQKVDLIIRKDIHQNGSVPDLSIPGLFSYELDKQNNEKVYKSNHNLHTVSHLHQ